MVPQCSVEVRRIGGMSKKREVDRGRSAVRCREYCGQEIVVIGHHRDMASDGIGNCNKQVKSEMHVDLLLLPHPENTAKIVWTAFCGASTALVRPSSQIACSTPVVRAITTLICESEAPRRSRANRHGISNPPLIHTVSIKPKK